VDRYEQELIDVEARIKELKTCTNLATSRGPEHMVQYTVHFSTYPE
jgi:hypothetical protein